MTEMEFPDQLTEEDSIRIGAALSGLVDSDAWGIFATMLRKRETDVGRFGIRDESKPRDYYLGYMDATAAVLRDVERLVAHARDAKTRMESDKGVQVRPRLGGGSLA